MAGVRIADESSTVRTLSPTLLLCLAAGILFLAACQPDTADPTAGLASTATVQEPTAEQPRVDPTPTATDSQANTAGESTAEADIAPVEETPLQETRVANADVEFVRAAQEAGGAWRFDVTVRHPDTGWDDYADGWDVITRDGQVLKANEDDPFTRLLLHPHENEQPFTRSQSGVVVPDGVMVVIVRAHDLVDGYGGREIEVDLTVDQGPGFEVSRQ